MNATAFYSFQKKVDLEQETETLFESKFNKFKNMIPEKVGEQTN